MQEEGVKDTFHRFYVNENVKVSDLDLVNFDLLMSLICVSSCS